jgi:DamX protein
MVDDDTFTYHVKQQRRDQVNTAAHSLITKERMQKLDLLIHLLSNLTQALVVCGPEGIGKTTLLDVLQKRKTELWRYCLIQGNADLSFESIHGQLTRCIKADAPVKSLSTAFKQYESQHKQVVLIVDNAGELVPGLIAAIIQYAAANPVLRVVFALTHDELQMKRGSDRVVDDCHIIEIPPLSEKQCGDFLQDLTTKPYANLSFKAIGENMIARIYRDTHGVPGRIIAEVSGLAGAKPSGKLKWVLVLAVAAAIAVAFGVQWLASSKNNDKEVIAPAAVEQETHNIEPQSEVQIMLPVPPAQPVIQPQQQLAMPTNEGNGALPSVEVNAGNDDQQLVIPAVKPEASSTIVIKPLPEQLEAQAQPEPMSAVQVEQKPINKQSVVAQQKIVEPLGASQEKPKQPELSKAANDVKPSIPEKSLIKAQPELANAVVPGNKKSAVAQQKIAESLVASQEKPKPAALSKTVNSVEPFAANKLDTAQVPQTPVEVSAVPKEPTIEPAAPQLAEPSRIGSLPIATLPPSLAGEASVASTVNNFTLQLMVLSRQSSADDMLKKYPALEPDIRVIKSTAKGKEKFILEYGSYSDAASANKARQSLPFEFHNALVRKIAR